MMTGPGRDWRFGIKVEVVGVAFGTQETSSSKKEKMVMGRKFEMG